MRVNSNKSTQKHVSTSNQLKCTRFEAVQLYLALVQTS